ncbi:MAG: restriction endonuclease subunit S [Thermoanaerobaculia bacterium]
MTRLRYVARLVYGEALPANARFEGDVPMMGSNGSFAVHSHANTLGPAVIVGRKGSFGKVTYSEKPCFCIDTAFFVDDRYTNADLRWLFYALQDLGLDGFTQDTGVPGLSREKAYDLGLCHPPRSAQRAIAAFLDRKTAAIDALIQKKERQIELLQEKRQALITQAVTKGLDAKAPMKDSGVSWMGEIPAHWQVSKIRYEALTVSKGTTPSTVGREMADQGVRFIKAENVEAEGFVAPLPEFFIDADTDALLSRSRLQAEDILVVIAGATTGKTAVLDRSLIPANTNQAVCFVRLKSPPLAAYLQAWLSSRLIQEQVWLNAVQAAQPNLSMEDIRSFVCPRPPDEEARAIIATLLQIRDAFHKTTIACERQILRLREYREALISAAVTGKIEIPAEEAA